MAVALLLSVATRGHAGEQVATDAARMQYLDLVFDTHGSVPPSGVSVPDRVHAYRTLRWTPSLGPLWGSAKVLPCDG